MDFDLSLTGFDAREIDAFTLQPNAAEDDVPPGGPVRQLLQAPTSMGLEVGPDRYAFGASSSAGVNIQGLHGSNVPIIADEAPGIESDIWDTIEAFAPAGTCYDPDANLAYFGTGNAEPWTQKFRRGAKNPPGRGDQAVGAMTIMPRGGTAIWPRRHDSEKLARLGPLDTVPERKPP